MMSANIVLEKKCETCDGSGREAGRIRCETCNGRGYVVTDDGERVLTFLRRHLREEQS
jgi:DnaJ-class molecular chaperone